MLTQKRLKELLHYDLDTGAFTYLVDVCDHATGAVAGSIVDGYIRICLDGTPYSAHRLAFLYVDGYFPEHMVDHRDGIRDNNKWMNLRHATSGCNSRNRAISPKNTSGYSGVGFNANFGKWFARISVEGKCHSLGLHDTFLDAALARICAEDCIPEWNCNERNAPERAMVFSLF